MKKNILLVLFVILLALCGCRKNAGDEVYDKFIVISRESSTWDIDLYTIYDKDTYVMYYYVNSSYKFDLCPIYNSNGEIMIYEGDD